MTATAHVSVAPDVVLGADVAEGAIAQFLFVRLRTIATAIASNSMNAPVTLPVRSTVAALTGLLALTLLGAPAIAAAAPRPAPRAQGQPAPAPSPGQPAPAAPSETPAPKAGPAAPSAPLTQAELNRFFEAYALLQAQSMLRLTDDQYADFIVRLRALHAVRRRHQQAHHRLVQELRKLTNPQNTTADEAVIKTTLEALTRADATAQEEIRQATEQLDELLDVRQRARFRVFEEDLERRKLDLLSRVRRAGRDRPAPRS